MSSAQATADMSNCEVESYKRWDTELNRVYAELRGKIDKDAQQALKDSQQKWLAYRDAERKTITAIYDSRHGTMYIPIKAGAVRDLVKDRVLALRVYAFLFSDSDP